MPHYYPTVRHLGAGGVGGLNKRVGTLLFAVLEVLSLDLSHLIYYGGRRPGQCWMRLKTYREDEPNPSKINFIRSFTQETSHIRSVHASEFASGSGEVLIALICAPNL